MHALELSIAGISRVSAVSLPVSMNRMTMAIKTRIAMIFASGVNLRP